MTFKKPRALAKASENGFDPKSEKVLWLLSAEIERLYQDETRQGWTPWALVGGLGAVVWLLLVEALEPGYTLEGAAYSYVGIFLALDVSRWLALAVGTRSIERRGRPRFQFSYERYAARLTSLVRVLRHAFILGILSWLPFPRQAPFWWIAVVFYVLLGSSMLYAIIKSFSRTPVTRQEYENELLNRLGYLIMTSLVGFAAVKMAALIFANELASLEDLRIAAPAVAITLLLIALSTQVKASDPLGTLVRLRQRVALGKVDASTAEQELEIALLGITYPDFLEKELVGLESLWQGVQTITNRTAGRLNEMERALERATDTLESTELSTILEDSAELLEHCQRLHSEYHIRSRNLSRQVKRLVTPGVREAVALKKLELQELEKVVGEQIRAARKKVEELSV